jgi:hypothetical protein
MGSIWPIDSLLESIVLWIFGVLATQVTSLGGEYDLSESNLNQRGLFGLGTLGSGAITSRYCRSPSLGVHYGLPCWYALLCICTLNVL